MVKSPKALAPTEATPFLLPVDTELLTSMALLEAKKPSAGSNLMVSRVCPSSSPQLLANALQATKLPLEAECIALEHEMGALIAMGLLLRTLACCSTPSPHTLKRSCH